MGRGRVTWGGYGRGQLDESWELTHPDSDLLSCLEIPEGCPRPQMRHETKLNLQVYVCDQKVSLYSVAKKAGGGVGVNILPPFHTFHSAEEKC